MPFSSGTFTLATVAVVTGTVISSSAYNDLTEDVAENGLTLCITKDGQSTITANIPFSGFRLTGIGVPGATGDALREGSPIGAVTRAAISATTGNFNSTLACGTLTVTGDVTINSSTSSPLTISTPNSGGATQMTCTASANTANSAGYWFYANNGDATSMSFANLVFKSSTTTAGAEVGTITLSNRVAGSMTDVFNIVGSAATFAGNVIATGSISATNASQATLQANYTGTGAFRATMTTFNNTFALYNETDSQNMLTYVASTDVLSLFSAGTPRLTLTTTTASFGGTTTINMTDSGTTLTVGVGADNGTVSAGVFTDRTKHYDGDALAELCNVKGKDGHIDHDTLPEFCRATVKRPIMADVERDGKTVKEQVGEEDAVERDLGAMISMLTAAIQQLSARVAALEKP